MTVLTCMPILSRIEMIIEDIPRINARKYPNKTAVVFQNTRYTFKELNDRINSLANALTSLGLEKGDRIAVIADNCNQHLEMFWVAVKTGMVTLTPNPALSQQELSYLINNAGARAIIFGQNYRELVESLRPQLKDVKDYIEIGSSGKGARSYEELISSHPPTELGINIDDNDLLALPCTSGTTGLPKQVMISYRNALVTVLQLLHAYDAKEKDIFLYLAPAFWTWTLPMVTICSFYLGCTLVIARDMTPPSILEITEKEGITNVWTATALVSELIDYPDLDKYDYRSLRRVVAAGASLPVEAWRRAVDIFGNIFIIGYGIAECGYLSFLFPEDFIFEGSPEKTKRIRSCGKETIHVEIRVVDEQDNDVQPGQLGEVIVRGNAMMRGYWNAPKATQEAIKGGYFYTGDLATVDEEGYIYLSGRKKDVITSQGKMLIPSEIEDIIYRNPQVLETAVIGVPDRELGEAVKAIVVLKKGGEASKDEIIELCQHHLPAYAVPKSADFIERLPRNPSGKILRYVLHEKYAQS